MRNQPSVVALAAVLCIVSAVPAFGQQRAQRLEVAAQASFLRLSDFGLNTPVGMGGRVSFDVTDWLAIEGEVVHFPTEKVGSTGTIQSLGEISLGTYRRRTDALFGAKVGMRGQRFGVFAKARPGITRLSGNRTFCEGPGCAVYLPPPPFSINYRTELAFDVGGGMEFYPAGRLVARAEIGDTIIRHRNAVPPCPSGECTTHNLSTRLGFGYRF